MTLGIRIWTLLNKKRTPFSGRFEADFKEAVWGPEWG